jgi:hypothetical protein
MKFYVLRLVDWLPNAVSVQQIKNQLIVTVTAVLCCDRFCHATGIFCPRRFPPPNVIS